MLFVARHDHSNYTFARLKYKISPQVGNISASLLWILFMVVYLQIFKVG